MHPDPFCKVPGLFKSRIRQEYEKFLAAIAAQNVINADGLADAPGDFLQHFIAGQMPLAVVNDLEMIYISDDAAEVLLQPPGLLKFLIKSGQDMMPVEQSRQFIRYGYFFNRLPCFGKTLYQSRHEKIDKSGKDGRRYQAENDYLLRL